MPGLGLLAKIARGGHAGFALLDIQVAFMGKGRRRHTFRGQMPAVAGLEGNPP